MNTWLRFVSVASALGCASMGPQALAQTTANGPYYATPSWDQTMPASTRFVVLSNFNNQAVLDRETGLIWERQINFNLHSGPLPMPDVTTACASETTGGRMGWRIPSYAEMTTLFDPTVASPHLPAGHPFVLAGPNGLFPGSGNGNIPPSTSIIWLTGSLMANGSVNPPTRVVVDQPNYAVVSLSTYDPNTDFTRITIYNACVRASLSPNS